MPRRFWKMSGAGNDFVVLPLDPQAAAEDVAGFVRSVCLRGLSVGADGVLFVSPVPGMGDADARLVHFNSDGSRSEFCGNGSRCAARFTVAMGWAGPSVRLATDVGILRAEVGGSMVRIEAPTPTTPAPVQCRTQGATYEGWLLTAGVPHFVLRVDSVEEVDVAGIGPLLRSHTSLGPSGANVDFLGPAQGGHHPIRTFERGVEAETLACGSGALAASRVLAALGERSPIRLKPTSGAELVVEFEGDPSEPRSFRLAGDARIVFEGVLSDEAATAQGEGHSLPTAAGPSGHADGTGGPAA